MFERFTDRARHVVVLAQEEARRLDHNYIGTEHLLLGLLAEPKGLAFTALSGFGVTLEGARDEVIEIVGVGKKAPSGHIPFTPRAKKTLELALREAGQLHHNYIGTEHLLLAVIREGDGVGPQILKRHGELLAIRASVLDLLGTSSLGVTTGRRWFRRFGGSAAGSGSGPAGSGASGSPEEQTMLSATPAADSTLTEAARLAGARPVGSHHLLLAALADQHTAASRALVALGVDLDRAREALRNADVTGTSDEQPEEAGRRQMVIHVSDDRLTIEATDPVIIEAGRVALWALGDLGDADAGGSGDSGGSGDVDGSGGEGTSDGEGASGGEGRSGGEGALSGTIRGDLPASASLSTVWHALKESLEAIARRATPPAESGSGPAEVA